MNALKFRRTFVATLAVGLTALAGSIGYSHQAVAGACQLIDGAPDTACVVGDDIKNKEVKRVKLAKGIIPYVTILKYNSTTSDFAPGTIKFLRNLGTFKKQRSDTDVKLTWIGHATVDGLSCFFQLRVDDQTESGTSSLTGGAIVNNDDSGDETDVQQFSVTAYFQDLPKGELDIDVWDRGVAATECTLNPGNWTHTVFIEETYSIFTPQIAPAAEVAVEDIDDGTGTIDSEMP